MNSDGWQQIEILFHTARELDENERNAYLAQMCREDELLRSEVESLLSFEDKSDFMELPAFDFGMQVLHINSPDPLVGKTIGVFQVLEKLGSGGMGEVYLAKDTRLNRKVALKFLSEAFINDKWAKRQLVKEAQAAARLDHHNICAVHGIEESEEHSFIVMQYVEGETLSRVIQKSALKANQILPLIQQIAGGLALAHAHGIIHRDIKPGNIMITAEGQAKVLDFGLAKTVQPQLSAGKADEQLSQLSHNGLIIGTVAYMSPEQLRAEKLDYRSDIFSLGAVFYELVSGRHPFAETSDAETISAILKNHPAPITNLKSELPPRINRIILKCLAKDKEQRYQSISELLLDLQENKLQRVSYIKQYRVALLALLLFLFAGLGSTFYTHETKAQSLVVLPFINETLDSNFEYITDGMTESIINRVSDSAKIKVKPYTLVSGYKGSDIDPLKIGRALDAAVVLTGKLTRRNNQNVLQIALIRTADGSQLWGDKEIVLENTSDVFRIQQDITENVISNFKATGDVSGIQTSKQTQNPEAFNFYLVGRSYWRKRDRENIQKAIEAYRKAIDIDPAFAQAFAGLANSYVLLSSAAFGSVPTKEAMTKAKAAAKEAVEIDGNLGESHAALAVVLHKYEWNWAAAENEYLRAIELKPDLAAARYWYSDLLAVTGRINEAISESEKARELDPFSPAAEMNVGRMLYYARRYDEAAEYLSAIINKNPENLGAIYVLGLVYIQKGMHREALAEMQKIRVKNKLFAAAALGYTYAKSGNKTEAIKILEELDEYEKASKDNHIPPQERAIIYIGLNDKDNAFIWLDKSYEERLYPLINLTIEPLFDDLRSDSRFQNLAGRMNLN
jgi:serine/threonine-protein kinase